MKKTTIILFSFALILIVAGAVLCFIGTRSGDVFDNTVIPNETITTEVSENVKSIVVNLNEVTVNVYGNYNCESSEIVTKNVDAEQIKNKPATELKITDKTSIFDMALDTVQNFSGLRDILFREKVNTGAKTVDIYISKNDNVDLTQLTVYAEKGTVNIMDMTSTTSYTLEITETTDNVTIDNVSTGSNIYLNVGKGSVSVKNNVSAVKIEALMGEGNFYLTTDNPDGYACDFSTDAGTVYIFDDASLGTKEDGKHTYQSEAGAESYTDVIVKTKKGDISKKAPKTEQEQKTE